MPLKLVNLTALMERTSGSPELTIGIIDGPIVKHHPALTSEHIREIPGSGDASCTDTNRTACLHGTFVAGILSAKRNSLAPAICPDCTLVSRPIFTKQRSGHAPVPTATPEELADAISECIDAGARVINLSLAVAQLSTRAERSLEEALNQTARRGVIVVAAAGNQGSLRTSPLTRHPWVIAVVACDLRGKPLTQSNLAGSIGRRGLTAPGDAITSLSAEGPTLTLSGTSVAAPFVTGTAALLWSVFPTATAGLIKRAVSQTSAPRTSIVPPLLDAAAAYQTLERA